MSDGDIQLFNNGKNEFSDLGGSDDNENLSNKNSPPPERTVSPPPEQNDTNGFTHNVSNTKLDRSETQNKVKNNFIMNQENGNNIQDEEPISTMKQDDPNKYVKEKTPKCDIDLPDKIEYPSQRNQGDNRNLSASQKDIVKPRRRSTIRESAVNEMKSFEIFKKFEDDENIKNEKLCQFLDDYRVQAVFLMMTIFTLFGDDYRLFSCRKGSDPSYDAFTIFNFAVFFCEIVISILAYYDYQWSYFFWLDVLSTLSLILDIVQLRDEILLAGQGGGFDNTKMSKVLRLVRMVRLVRISKIYKQISGGKKESKKSRAKEDSRVGRKMSDQATKRLIMTTFMLIVCLPMFEADFWVSPGDGLKGLCFQLASVYSSDSLFTNSYPFEKGQYMSWVSSDIWDQNFVDQTTLMQNQKYYFDFMITNVTEHYGNTRKLLRLQVPGSVSDNKVDMYTYYEHQDYTGYRIEEMIYAECAATSFGEVTYYIKLWRDNSFTVVFGALLNIGRTIFVSTQLQGGSLQFGRDIYLLIISPIERMMERVTQVIKNPQKVKELAFIEQEELANKEEEKIIEDDDEDKPKEDKLETQVIEDAIKKIGILLGIGLGEAGTGLITNYLSREGDVDIMIPGKMYEAIFGFCDIRNFTDATEVLQESVMVFVNRIGMIIHTLTDKHLGYANKNIGDAFLLVWKYPRAFLKYPEKYGHLTEVIKGNMADLSFFCFLKVFAELNRSEILREYPKNALLCERIPNYKVRMGYGLHFGWAIEGAIGSPHKVDASYLSPHVNVAARLEGDTKAYGVPFLLSGDIYDLFSTELKSFARLVDVICIKGSDEPERMYTANVSDIALKFPKTDNLVEELDQAKRIYNFKRILKSSILQGNTVGPSLFEYDKDIPIITCYIQDEFLKLYNMAMKSYVQGDWKMAKNYFEQGFKIDPKDGPSNCIYGIIQEHNFNAPGNWKGYRVVNG